MQQTSRICAAFRYRYRPYNGDIAMPPGPKSAKDKQSRRLTRAKAKREAKARERNAKAANINLDYEETVRAKMLEKAGIPPDERDRFLAFFAKHYKSRFAKTEKFTKPKQSLASPSSAPPGDATRSKK
jgi:hypothetical protein